MRSSSNAVVKHNPKSAKVNMMNAAQAEESTDVIMSNLSVNDFPVKVLFDTGASLSFITQLMPLSRASTCGRYSRIVGVTPEP